MRFLAGMVRAAVLALLPVVAACDAVDGRNAPPALDGTAWILESLSGESAVPGSQVTLRFADGMVRGSDGCNGFGASYESDEEGFRVPGTMASTQMTCPEPVMKQAAAFLAALSAARNARTEGGRLRLRGEGGTLLATLRAQSEELAGTTWRVAPGALGLALPATFRGDLPCADCETIRHHLDLWPDGVFHLRRIWVGRDLARDELGRFRVDESRKALVLDGGAEMPLQLEVKGSDRLRMLDMEGKPIHSQLPYELVSDGTLAPTDLSLFLAGEMRYMADAARFTVCRTGRSYPIVQEADFIALERGYREAVREPGAPLYVTFEGEIAPRPRMDGEGLETSVVVRRFVGAWPDRKCGV